ncbi:unnamed protein product [Cuscuta epithymum]|uniref:Uncharacterized protein n=2 Tax=Cuscuta epithymum TaxID=186058 RepID=A0AAV0F1A4_9ASTE|nr:unnamed protein product [Cuscuta epithymum]
MHGQGRVDGNGSIIVTTFGKPPNTRLSMSGLPDPRDKVADSTWLGSFWFNPQEAEEQSYPNKHFCLILNLPVTCNLIRSITLFQWKLLYSHLETCKMSIIIQCKTIY